MVKATVLPDASFAETDEPSGRPAKVPVVAVVLVLLIMVKELPTDRPEATLLNAKVAPLRLTLLEDPISKLEAVVLLNMTAL